jgi:outer membrane protein assembly factor BamE
MREQTRSDFAARPRAALMLCSAAMAASLGACSYLPEMPSMPTLGSFKAYRIDIQQGNYLSAEMVSQLKEGMTREQVRFVLGTPLVTDVFHADRWDYVFYRELGNGKIERRHLSVFFEDNKLKRFAGENLPTAAPPAAAAQSAEKK